MKTQDSLKTYLTEEMLTNYPCSIDKFKVILMRLYEEGYEKDDLLSCVNKTYKELEEEFGQPEFTFKETETMGKSQWLKCFESMSKEDYSILTDELRDKVYKAYLESKADAFDRIMSGGKKTLKEWANIFGKPIVVDYDDTILVFSSVPRYEGGYSQEGEYIDDWIGEVIARIDCEYDGEYVDDVTLPDGWED